VDYNCDGSVQYEDADGDDWAACEDCDDNNSTINPDADEECDFLDNNCDGTVDEGTAVDADTFYADLDGDGFGDEENTTTACHDAPSGYTADLTDCDDDNALTYPGADEVCDAADNDCDGLVGEALVPTDYATIQDGVDSEESWICVEAGTYTENVVIIETTDFTLSGVGSADVIVDGGGVDRTIYATDNTNLTITGLTIQNGYIDDDFGAGLYVEGGDSVVVDDIVATANTHDNFGFGLAITLGYMDSLVATDIEVHTNDGGNESATYYGAFAVIRVTDVELDGISVHDNTSTGTAWSGGVMLYENDTVWANDLSVTDNVHADEDGYHYAPVVSYSSVSMLLTASSITGNTSDTAFGVGGGYFAYADAEVEVNLLDVRGNSVNLQDGGGLFSGGVVGYYSDTSTWSNLIVAGNTVTEDEANAYVYGGGALFLGGATVTNATVYGNDSTLDQIVAGGIGCGYGTLTLTNTAVTDNTATGVTEAGAGIGDLDSCTFVGTYNNAYGNDNADYDTDWTDPTGTDGNLSVDAIYADVTSTTATDWDLSLDSTSTLIDAGDTAILDADGTTSDIGAYGGPDGDSW
jgi:hypothetical protein